MFTEGDEGGVIVQRNSIRPSRPVTLYVEAREYTGAIPLQPGEHAADATGTIIL